MYKEQGNLGQALAHYRKALELKEQCVRVRVELWARGLVSTRSRRSYADAHGNMAGVLLQQQRLEEAAKHYTRALELNQGNACWLVDLGHIHRVAGRRAEAKLCFIKATAVNPGFAIAFSNLACIYKDEGVWRRGMPRPRLQLRLCRGAFRAARVHAREPLELRREHCQVH